MDAPPYCLLILFLFTTSCHSDQNGKHSPDIDTSHQEAIPHTEGQESLPLSTEDRLKLLTATGKEVDTISGDQLIAMIDNLEGKLHLLNFWSIDCIPCLNNNQTLKKYQNMQENESINIYHINLDDLETVAEVNASIREQGLINDCFIVESDQLASLYPAIKGNWDGSLPAMLLVNQEEGIRLFYQNKFSQEELTAVLAPFTW